MSNRKPIVAMSWSMRQNKNEEARQSALHLLDELRGTEAIEQIIFPSMGTLATVSAVLSDSHVGVGAQNIAPYLSGEYSGEYAIESLVDIGGRYVELGHWERRALFGETDELINQKLLLTVENGLTPVLCVGENQRLTDAQLKTILMRQLFNALLNIRAHELNSVIIAYTPGWAVGKSSASNAPHIHQTGAMIRDILRTIYPKTDVGNVRVIYGGSVSPENTALIVQNEAIDGVLLGRFGSDPRRFAEVVHVITDNL